MENEVIVETVNVVQVAFIGAEGLVVPRRTNK